MNTKTLLLLAISCGCSANRPDGEIFTSTTVIREADGTEVVKTIPITRAQEIKENIAKQDWIEKQLNEPSDGVGVTRQALSQDGACSATSLWVYDQMNFQGNRICFQSDTSWGAAVLSQYPLNGGTWEGAPRSYQAGSFSGGFYYQGGSCWVHFNAYTQNANSGIGSCVQLATMISQDMHYMSIRVGRPLIGREPGVGIDNPFNELKLNSGQFRGFTANGSTWEMTGADPWSMDGTPTAVLNAGLAGSYSECGAWINHVERQGSNAHGFFHAERPPAVGHCGDQQHNWSMAFAQTTDEGMTWSAGGQIITGTDQPDPNKATGEGSCTMVDMGAYYYAYCLRNRDFRTIIVRAPVGTPQPGNWNKFFLGGWASPGLGGDADTQGYLGYAAGRWVDNNDVVLLGSDKFFGGLKISYSSNQTSFVTLAEPLLALDDVNWIRGNTSPSPVATELVDYPSVMNYTDANNQITSPFLLTYMYIQPYQTFDIRYLVFRDVWMTPTAGTTGPQVGVAISRWFNAALPDRWSTTQAVPGNFSSYVFEGSFGFLLTRPDPVLPTNKLVEGVGCWPGHPDHIVAVNLAASTTSGACPTNQYARLRTAGWVYQTQQTNTKPLYRCFDPSRNNHFVSNQSNCESLGNMESLLGYALAN